MRLIGPAKDTLAAVPTNGGGLVITDPPWDLQGAGKFDLCASYPRLSPAEVADIMDDAKRALVPGGHFYCFAPAGDALETIMAEFKAHGWRYLRTIAWDKGTHRGLGAYRNAWEPVLIYSNGPSRGFELTCTYSSLLKAKPAVEARTAKPWPLYKIFMEMSSRAGELVIDPFCGTNPLEAAAKQLQPSRRWLAGDIFTPAQVADQLKNREWAKAGGDWGGDRPLRTAGARLEVS